LNIKFPPEDELPDHPWIGRQVRGISEKQFGCFERPGKVQKINGNGEIIWLPEDRLVPWTSHIDDLEFWPPLKEKARWKAGKISSADMQELKISLPDLKKRLEKKDELEDLHVVLGSWLVYRDFLRDHMKPWEMPCLVNPQVVHTFSGAAEDGDHEGFGEISAKILQGLWKRHGLLGVPIQQSGHWTLLVLRRSSQITKIRYYDSLADHNQEKCLETAEKVLKLLEPELHIPDRRNKLVQQDSISCGLFVLHYWEGEVRQFCGEGWSIGAPSQILINKIRSRLRNVTENIEESQGKVVKNMKKVEIENGSGVPHLPAANKLMEYLKTQAKASQDQGLVEFFGCSRCRWSRGGCISWLCNHQKFLAHFEKYPEKYEKSQDAQQKCKELKLEAEQKLTKCELMS
jgi:hypothetical protein